MLVGVYVFIEIETFIYEQIIFIFGTYSQDMAYKMHMTAIKYM